LHRSAAALVATKLTVNQLIVVLRCNINGLREGRALLFGGAARMCQ
jgi:hypothetical protein